MIDAALPDYVEKTGKEVNFLLVGPGTDGARENDIRKHLEGKDFRLTVLDINQENLKDRQTDGRSDYVQGDVVTADLSGYGPFDLVECLMVLPWVDPGEAKVEAMRNMAGSMKKDGVMIVDDLFHNDPESSIEALMAPLLSSVGLVRDRKIPKEYSSGIPYLFYRKQ